MMKQTNFKRILSLLCLLLAVLLLAQSEPPLVWGQQANAAEPVNLSRSGGSSAPFVVLDADGVAHVVWDDESLGTMYTREEGSQWREPVPVVVPFAEEQPLLKADAQGQIHAFWRNEDNELFYSRVAAASFAEAAAWTVPQQLAASALALDVAVAESGRLYLAYVRQLETEEAPAGIYYRQSGVAGEGQSSWSPAQLIERNAYFRSMAAANARVQIAHSSLLGRLFVAWDNRALDQVFVIRSDNEGQSWQTPVQVDQREATDTTDAVGPSNIRIATHGVDVHLIWQAGHGGPNCALYHQRSGDGGQTWDSRQPLWDQCFQSLRFLGIHEGLLMLLLIREDGGYVIAWDGQRWSEPQRQPTATLFLNPDTLRTVSLGCQEAVAQAGRLVIVGCGQNQNPDIWVLEQGVGETEDWFPPPSIWRSPERVMAQNRIVNAPVSPTFLTTDQDQMHLFWYWPDAADIYYSAWDGTRWLLQPAQVFNSPGGGQIDLTVLTSAPDRFGAFWSDTVSGRLYFSQVGIEQAALSSAWFDAAELALPQEIASAPTVVRLPDNRLLLAYTVPINEGRGIYTTTSSDRGLTWSEPAQLFDGADAGWPVVGSPHLTQTDSGELHMMWLQGALTEAQRASRLVYAYSSDGGETWSTPQTVADTAVSNPLIAGVGQAEVHRIWQTHTDGRVSLWHQYSVDNGRSWSRAAVIGGTTVGGFYTIVKDAAGGVHMLRIADLTLEHWQWDGSQWISQEGVTLRSESGGSPTILGLAATVSARRGLVVAYTQTERVQGEQQPPWLTTLYVTSRGLDDLEAVPTPTLVAIPAPQLETTTATPPPLPTPTPTVVFINDLDENGGDSAGNNTVWGLIVGAVAAILVVSVAFVLGFRTVRGG
jgi:hypothetical protein